MKLSELINYIKIGHDIEFFYHDREFSITPCYDKENQTRFISFCEFYKEPTDYLTIEEFLASAEIDGEKLTDILGWITHITVF